MDINRVRDYISKVYWKPTNHVKPHEYTVREWNYDLESDFIDLVMFIREKGKDEYFFRKKYRKIEIDGYKYWTMGNPIEETTVINRSVLEVKSSTKWDYGNFIEKYPVVEGDVYKIGVHSLLCENIMNVSPEVFKSIFPLPDLIYVDPPWLQSNLTCFLTKNGMSEHIDFKEFLTRVISLCKLSKGYCFTECSSLTIYDFVNEIVTQGGSIIQIFDLTYYRTKPCKLIWFSFVDISPVDIDLNGIDDEKTPALIIQKFTKEGDIVCDFCFGRGLTAVETDKRNRTFIGIELNPRRMAHTIDKLLSNKINTIISINNYKQ